MATAVSIKKYAGFKPVAVYDSDNGNDVTNTLSVGIKIALAKNGVVVDGTEVFLNPGETKTYDSGLDADSIVYFIQETGSKIEPTEVYAE